VRITKTKIFFYPSTFLKRSRFFVLLSFLFLGFACFVTSALADARYSLLPYTTEIFRYGTDSTEFVTNQQVPAGQTVKWRTIRMRVTAYCPCPKCCGQFSDGITASGHKINQEDRFVAADKNFTFQTEMLIPGYNSDKPVKVLDRGGAIQGNRLDVFFNTHEDALAWGVQYLDVKVRL
jgi:3D (Asp-Asp-Asp) domain-containing protein